MSTSASFLMSVVTCATILISAFAMPLFLSPAQLCMAKHQSDASHIQVVDHLSVMRLCGSFMVLRDCLKETNETLARIITVHVNQVLQACSEHDQALEADASCLELVTDDCQHPSRHLSESIQNLKDASCFTRKYKRSEDMCRAFPALWTCKLRALKTRCPESPASSAILRESILYDQTAARLVIPTLPQHMIPRECYEMVEYNLLV